MSKVRYLNAPIELYKDFLDNHKECLYNVAAYSIYAHSLKLELGDDFERFNNSLKYFGISRQNPEEFYKYAEELYNSIDTNGSAMFGINIKTFLQFYRYDKTEFEKVCLLAHLSLKSIIGDKKYIKSNNDLLFSRMSGSTKLLPHERFNESLLNYYTKRKIENIKNHLIIEWKLKYYSNRTRGFYFSYSLKERELIEIAERLRFNNQVKVKKQESKNLRKEVLKSLNQKFNND